MTYKLLLSSAILQSCILYILRYHTTALQFNILKLKHFTCTLNHNLLLNCAFFEAAYSGNRFRLIKALI